MKKYYNCSNYGNDLKISLSDANLGCHSGECDDDIKHIKELPYIKKQLKKLDPIQLKKELFEYGAWDDSELNSHDDNINRWLWISCGDIIENMYLNN